ncbi:MAG: nicotinate phosphoribosyltransferase [Bacteroidales bacterium]|nr:nicotinate phosphoribosyltransferase [Bacteroidales bacterium]
MKFPSIITDFDDQDAYKFFMQYAVLKFYPEAKVKYSLIVRDPAIEFPPGFGELLKEQIHCFEEIQFTGEIEGYMTRKNPWFDAAYIEYLRAFRFDPDEVKIRQTGGKLDVIIEGFWHKTILWEVPLMACISELYYRISGIPDAVGPNSSRWEEKFRHFASMHIAVIEFGTRRRKSKLVQEKVIGLFLKTAPETIKGTSNVMFARKFAIPASGTQAHEWFMFHAARYGVRMATKMALEKWVETYHGALGIALTDTFTTDVFFRDFDLFFSKLFDGIRQDSGDPVIFAHKAIAHYQDKKIILPNGLIPKTLVFSDAIDTFEKISNIENAVRNKIFSVYGIGTWITNDIIGNDGIRIKPLNMVIKMTEAKPDEASGWIPCFKLTDSPEKLTGQPNIINNYIHELYI